MYTLIQSFIYYSVSQLNKGDGLYGKYENY